MVKNALKGIEAHTVYKLKDGEVVPGVTTITSRIPKPYLYGWANKLGLEGISYDNYMDITAEIGTAIHNRVEAYIESRPPDLSMVRPEHDKYSLKAIGMFVDWWESHKDTKPIATEKSMVSEQYGYGGTVDIICMIDGEVWLIDIKTGAKIYDDYACQLAALRHLCTSNAIEVDHVAILRLGRDDIEGIDIREFGTEELNIWFDRFLCLLDDYNFEKMLETPAFRRK